MIRRVIDGEYVSEFTVRLRFDDGKEGEIDLRDELWGPMFEPLRNVEYFRRFKIHPELHTIVWENGADFSPEFLYNQVRATA